MQKPDHSPIGITETGMLYSVLCPLHSLLLAILAIHYAPTSDEVAHLAAGVRVLESATVDSYLVNPPLVKAIAALPVFAQNPKTSYRRHSEDPKERTEWQVGQDFIYVNGPVAFWYFTTARWMCIPFSLLGMCVAFSWSRDMWGSRAGIASALIWCSSPSILGNGCLITPDVACASLSLASAYMFRLWLSQPNWKHAATVSVVLGLAQLTKMTCVLLYPAFVFIWLVSGKTSRSHLLQFGMMTVGSVGILNLGYLGEGSFKPLGSYRFASVAFGGTSEGGNRFSGSSFGSLPVPLPGAYMRGLDIQRLDFEGQGIAMDSYMSGELAETGWWYYYLYAGAVKLPLAGIALVLAGLTMVAFRWWKKKTTLAEALMLFVPCVLFLVVVSSQTGFSRYFRYVLPSLPFAIVGIGCLFAGENVIVRRVATVLSALFVAESLAAFPNSLSFFNVLAGGPKNGHLCLLDSNVDWGQDLYSIKKWTEQQGINQPIFVAYSGVADPRVLGLNTLPVPTSHDSTPPELDPGYYFVSANHLHGYDAGDGSWAYFRSLPLHTQISPSIFVYRVEQSDAK